MSEKVINTAWLEKAQGLMPELRQQKVYPERIVSAVPDTSAFQGWRIEPIGLAEHLSDQVLCKGDRVTLDFGEHLVGYLPLEPYPREDFLRRS